MQRSSLKEKLIEDIEDLPEKKVKAVIDFVGYLKIKEDDWFIQFVNKRGARARAERGAGKRFKRLEELQKEYR